MRCQGCQFDNPVTNNYCEACGVRLTLECVQCGHRGSPSAEFCGQCGARLRQISSHHIPGGERKQATVLFADIVDSTRLIADLDAEEAIHRLRPIIALMARSVRRFDGAIVRSLGDGLKAVFGAPRAQEGHAILACRAALAMQEAIAALGSAPQIRIGLHSGEVVAGELDTGSAFEQEAAGLTVHIASRMEQLAGPAAICMSRDCRQLVGAYCDTVSLGRQAVKGVAAPVEIYRLLGLKPAVASEQFRSAELSPFQGRQDELTLLKQALIDAEHGSPGVIGICASPGIGKSRLCYEFGEWCRRRLVDVLEARALIYGQATPLQPVLEMLRGFFRISPLDEAQAARQKVERHLLALDTSFEGDLPLLGDFLGIGDPDRPAPRLDPRARRARLRDIFSRMLRAAGRRPGVIIVEDLHWLDDTSADFVETLVDAIAGTHTLLVVNFRPSYNADWMGGPLYRELALAELAPPDIRHLVQHLVGDEPELREVCEYVADRSAGNPFFAEELIRSLTDSGVLVGERGRYRSDKLPDNARLPANVETVIGARIDRLEEREKLLLQVGAIIGKEFPLALLRRLTQTAAHEIDDLLSRLCGLGLIQAQMLIQGRGFAFRHPLIQEVAYNMQLRGRRMSLHAAVAEAVEEFDWGKLDEFAGLLAYHYEAAERPLEAAKHLQRAAVWVGKTDSAQALKHWKKVRWLLRDQPRCEQNDRMRAMASGQILNFGWREGMIAEEAKPYAEEALRYVREGGDRMHEPLILGAYGRITAATGAADEYVALVREALTLTSKERDAGRTATVYGMLAQAYYLAGLLNEALAANAAALAAVDEQRDMDGAVTLGMSVSQILGFDVEHWIKCSRTRILVQLDRFEEADEWLDAVFRIAPERVDPAVIQFIPHVAAVEMSWWRGDAARAQRHATQISEYAEQTAIPYLRVAAFDCMALAKSTGGDFVGAASDLEEGIAFARRVKAGLEFEARLLSDLADALYRGGSFGKAAEVSGEGIDVARRRTHRVAECHASLTRAAALATTGGGEHRETARGLLNRAEELIQISGAAVFKPLLGSVRLHVEACRSHSST
jgi:adenylate cyclase